MTLISKIVISYKTLAIMPHSKAVPGPSLRIQRTPNFDTLAL